MLFSVKPVCLFSIQSQLLCIDMQIDYEEFRRFVVLLPANQLSQGGIVSSWIDSADWMAGIEYRFVGMSFEPLCQRQQVALKDVLQHSDNECRLTDVSRCSAVCKSIHVSYV